jgi:hypothetical protein
VFRAAEQDPGRTRQGPLGNTNVNVGACGICDEDAVRVAEGVEGEQDARETVIVAGACEQAGLASRTARACQTFNLNYVILQRFAFRICPGCAAINIQRNERRSAVPSGGRDSLMHGPLHRPWSLAGSSRALLLKSILVERYGAGVAQS